MEYHDDNSGGITWWSNGDKLMDRIRALYPREYLLLMSAGLGGDNIHSANSYYIRSVLGYCEEWVYNNIIALIKLYESKLSQESDEPSNPFQAIVPPEEALVANQISQRESQRASRAASISQRESATSITGESSSLQEIDESPPSHERPSHASSTSITRKLSILASSTTTRRVQSLPAALPSLPAIASPRSIAETAMSFRPTSSKRSSGIEMVTPSPRFARSPHLESEITKYELNYAERFVEDFLVYPYSVEDDMDEYVRNSLPILEAEMWKRYSTRAVGRALKAYGKLIVIKYPVLRRFLSLLISKMDRRMRNIKCTKKKKTLNN